MKQVIIGIHGLGNKPEASTLKSWWLKSIKEGLNNIGKCRSRIPFEMVYWADIMHESPLHSEITDKENPKYIEEPYVEGKLVKRIDDTPLTKKVLQYIEEQLDKIFLNDDFSINFKNVTDKLIHHYFTELDTYYAEDCKSNVDKDCSARESIQKRLSSVLEKYKSYEILLIAHSMGTIIAFDVLSKMDDNFSINTFVTIGSPLGLPVIGGRIFAEQKQLNVNLKNPVAPDSISGSWYNLSDILDKIALDHTLNDDFDANCFGIKATDMSVYNNYEINNEPNPHKSYGYLRTTELATIIDTFLKRNRSDILFRKYTTVKNKFYNQLNTFRNMINKD